MKLNPMHNGSKAIPVYYTVESVVIPIDASATPSVVVPQLTEALIAEKKPLPTIPYLTRFIRGLYPTRQSFFDGDFKKLLINVQNSWGTLKESYLVEPTTSLFEGPPALTPKEVSLRSRDMVFVLNKNAFTSFWVNNAKGEMVLLPRKELIQLLFRTKDLADSNDSPSFIFLRQVFHWTLELLGKSALVPRLSLILEKEFAIQWVPALMSHTVATQFNALVDNMPDSISLYTREPLREWHLDAPPKALGLKKSDALLFMVATFISNFISANEEATAKLLGVLDIPEEKDIARMFFADRRWPITNNKIASMGAHIFSWLNKYNLGQRDYYIYLQFHELEGMDMGLEVLLKNKITDTYLAKESLIGPPLTAVKKDLQFLAEHFPMLGTFAHNFKQGILPLRWGDFQVMLEKSQPILEAIGVRFLLPAGLSAVQKPKISMHLKQRPGVESLSLGSALEFEWRVAIGDELMDPEKFSKLVQETRDLLRINSTYMRVIYGDVRQFLEQLKSPAKPTAIQLFHSALSEEYQGVRVEIDEALKLQIKALNDIGEVDLPLGLNATLRPYQQRGFSWMYKNARLGFGCLLADDMGLGKTIQVITFLLKLKVEGLLESHPTLVVAPTSLLSNWENEIKRFAPAIRFFVFHGSNRKEDFEGKDVIITTYGVIRSDVKLFHTKEWKALVVDEAQNIKNNATDQTKSIKQLNAAIKIALTGTPVENRLKEYWSIFDFINHGYLGNENNFNETFAKPIEIGQDKRITKRFLAITSPFILRRLKSDKSIIADLPDKIENDQFCSLTDVQARLYKATTDRLMSSVLNSEGINRRGGIFRLLTALKQICNHPAQYLKEDHEALPEESGKMQLLFQLLESIYENNEKVLLFSQYKETGNLLNKFIATKFGMPILQLHGGTTRPERDRMVSVFQEDPSVLTFILSLKAGGTGLNLTAANHVIHFDLWWNPAVESQASDRAYRIGQRKNVMIHRLITAGTLEEKIDNMLKQKRNLSDMTVVSGEKWIGELSNAELEALIGLNVG